MHGAHVFYEKVISREIFGHLEAKTLFLTMFPHKQGPLVGTFMVVRMVSAKTLEIDWPSHKPVLDQVDYAGAGTDGA